MFISQKSFLVSFMLLIVSAFPPKDDSLFKKSIVQKKHEYAVQTAEDGSTKRNLEYTSIFDKRGNELELTVWIPDSTYFSHGRCKRYTAKFNRSSLTFSDRFLYRYSSDTVMQITTFMCDTLPAQKQFFYYKRNAIGQVLEKKELSFSYTTSQGDAQNISLVDSLLSHSSITYYQYNKQGLKAQEITRHYGPDLYSYADTILYTYDSNQKLRKLEKILHDVTEISNYQYDDKGLLSTVTWEKPVYVKLNYHYNTYSKLIREVSNNGHRDVVFNYTYNGNGDLTKIVEADGYKIKITEFVYEYF
jgi:hypothetical protein